MDRKRRVARIAAAANWLNNFQFSQFRPRAAGRPRFLALQVARAVVAAILAAQGLAPCLIWINRNSYPKSLFLPEITGFHSLSPGPITGGRCPVSRP
jgi:hypothetical protein